MERWIAVFRRGWVLEPSLLNMRPALPPQRDPPRARARHVCSSPAGLARLRVAGASSSSQRSTGGAVCPLLALAPPAVPRESSTVRSRN